MPLTETLANLVADFSGVCGLAARNLTTGERVDLRADEPFPPASTIKVPVLLELFRQAEAGRLRLDEPLTLTAKKAVAGAGILRDLTPGLALSLRDAATLMIAISDNTASNLCIERVGVESINATCAALGLQRTRINRPLFGDPSLPLGETSPGDLADLLERLARGAGLLGPSSDGATLEPVGVRAQGCGAMLDILERQRVSFLAANVPEYAPPGYDPGPVRMAGKTGWVTGVRNDAALFWTPRATYVLVVLTRDSADRRRRHPDHEGERLLARIGEVFYAAWGRH